MRVDVNLWDVGLNFSAGLDRVIVKALYVSLFTKDPQHQLFPLTRVRDEATRQIPSLELHHFYSN